MKKAIRRYISAITGRFVSRKFAEQNSDTTVQKTMQPKGSPVGRVIRFVSSITGRFVSRAFAEKNPGTTYQRRSKK